MSEEKTEKKTAPRKPASGKRVTVHMPSPGSKVFTSLGPLGNGACVTLPEGEANRFLKLGKVRLTEATEDSAGEEVIDVASRPVTP